MKGHFFSRKSPNWLKSLGVVPSLTLYHICILICIFLHNINLLKLQENLALFKIFGSTLAQIFVCSVSFQFLYILYLYQGPMKNVFLKISSIRKWTKLGLTNHLRRLKEWNSEGLSLDFCLQSQSTKTLVQRSCRVAVWLLPLWPTAVLHPPSG